MSRQSGGNALGRCDTALHGDTTMLEDSLDHFDGLGPVFLMERDAINLLGPLPRLLNNPIAILPRCVRKVNRPWLGNSQRRMMLRAVVDLLCQSPPEPSAPDSPGSAFIVKKSAKDLISLPPDVTSRDLGAQPNPYSADILRAGI